MRENARHMEENAKLVEELTAAEERYQAERRLREELEDNLFIMPGNSQDWIKLRGCTGLDKRRTLGCENASGKKRQKCTKYSKPGPPYLFNKQGLYVTILMVMMEK